MRHCFLFIFILFAINAKLLAVQKDPLFRFIENKNQWNKNILFKADIPSGAVFLEKSGITYHLINNEFLHRHGKKDSIDRKQVMVNGHAFKINFLHANLSPIIDSENPFDDYYNYFLGKDRSKWASKVECFSRVRYQELYNGIDLIYYSVNNQLKYDFKVLPGSNPSVIQLDYKGLDKMQIENGELVLYTSLGKIIERKPYAYQLIKGNKVEVTCNYELKGSTVSFSFPQGYDRSKELIIDPVLLFSTYSGSTADNFGYTATFDSEGFLFSGSSAFGIGYPTTLGAYRRNFSGGSGFYGSGADIAITKYDTTGTKRIYSTYLGGNNDELPHSLIVNSNDELLIFGTTSSPNFPTTSRTYDSTFNGGTFIYMEGIAIEYTNGSDIIIAKLSQDGSALLNSTYIGGTGNDGLLADFVPTPLRYNYADEVRGEIEIDANDNILIATCTRSIDFPITGSPYQPGYAGGKFDAIVVKMNSTLDTMRWSTYLGAEGDDAAYALEIDSLNRIYVSGGTTSFNFPTTSGVLFPSRPGGNVDGFISHLDENGQTLLHSTYFGSSTYDQIYFVDLDAFDNVFVFGQTMAPGNTFIVNAGYSNPGSGQFVSKLQPDLSAYIWSTVFGNGSGRPNISPTAFLVDLCSSVYLSGWGGTPENNAFLNNLTYRFDNMPLKASPAPGNYFQSTTDHHDFYLFVIEDDASELTYASFYGGPFSDEHVDGGTSRFDRKGKIYQAICGGCGGFNDLPVTPTFPNNSYNCNCAVFKMDFNLPTVVADFTTESNCTGEVVSFVNKSLEQKATQFEWDFGDGSPKSTEKNPTHIYTKGGDYTVTLVVKDNLTCNLADTITKNVYISDIANLPVAATADKDTIYRGQSTTLHAIPGSGYTYLWSPAGSLNYSHIPNPTATPDTTTTYTVVFHDPKLPKCTKSAQKTIVVIEINCAEPHIFVPNAFTPDGDGKNDVLYVRSNNIATMRFAIFNRWGQKVFETTDQNIGWDGFYNGMKVDPGVFDYYLEGICINDEHFLIKGNVTLIR